MKIKIVDAKCPYCKTIFGTSAFGSNWAQTLRGQYAPSETSHICPVCEKESIITLSCTYRYSSKKKKSGGEA